VTAEPRPNSTGRTSAVSRRRPGEEFPAEGDMTGQADSERNMKVARWWAGREYPARRQHLQQERQTNGIAVGVAGLKRRIQERLEGFPDLPVDIEDLFSADDKVVTRLVWRGIHTGSYAGIKATGKRVEVPGFAIWRFEDGQVVEVSTIQDRFALLSRLDIFPAKPTRCSRPRWPGSLGAASLAVPARKGAGPVLAVPAGGVTPGAAGASYWLRQAVMRCPSHSPAVRICLTWENPGIRLSETLAGARAPRLTRNVADGRCRC
jgi:predicted ester cyclase